MSEEPAVRLDVADKRMLQTWARISVTNLFVLSLLGAALRYKAAFSLPAVNYKYLLNAHSHFAFTGWATTVIYTVLVYMLGQSGVRLSRGYRHLFRLNQISAYAMLICFSWQGYGTASIVASALSVLVSYGFVILYWLDMARTSWPRAVRYGVQLALVFLVLSSAGPFLLVYSMSHAAGMAFYYNSIYLFLHFQYNGWFSFSAIAAFFWMTRMYGWELPRRATARLVVLMGVACVPAYCLSLLWTDPPFWIWAVAGCAALVQLAALRILLVVVWRGNGSGAAPDLPASVRILWTISLVALVMKLVLQGLSAIPAVGRLAFGYRPVIIAYLHLVLLGFISIFFLGLLLAARLVNVSSAMGRAGLLAFVSGVIVNEIFLTIQSLAGYAGHGWETSVYWLFGVALWMAIGIAGMIIQRPQKQDPRQDCRGPKTPNQ
ncbi:MAG TPA: hypothetical protein VGR89_17100 [Puia sp.]|nr:hypothetical protein [Puia sp.]